MRVFYKFLKSDCWNCPRKVLMKFIPLRSQNPSNPDPPKNLLNGPSVRNWLNDKISFGFPSVPLRFRGYVILESLRTANGFNITCPKEWLPRPR